MKKTVFCWFGIILFLANILITPTLHASNSYGKTTLSGKITDQKTHESLPGVTIYIPDLISGTSSGIDGTYLIDNLPQTKVLVQVSFIGYKMIAVIIDLSTISVKDFELEESVTELNEIVVTGLSQAAEKNRTPTPISTIPKIQLLQSASSNIIDAISLQPGVSQITTGSAISKPVIRGLGYNRVVTVSDGIRQEGQQWGDEHGIEIDDYSINSVEILKGPASLAYGSDALAGVINLLPAPTLSPGKMTGRVLANFQTNNGLIGYSADFAGNQKGFIWDVRYSNKTAHSYRNKYDGFVFNSGFRQNAVSVITGVNKSWGYSHLHLDVFNLNPGIVEGERDSLNGNFVKPMALNDTTESFESATAKDFKSYNPVTPYQKIRHYKAVLNNSFIIGEGSLKVIIGFQQNQRKEFADILKENQYGLYFLLNTLNYDLRYIFPERNNFRISFGMNGMQQSSKNKGVEFLIPDYHLFDYGIFAVLTKVLGKFDINAGLRYDYRNIKGKDLYLNLSGQKVSNDQQGAIMQFAAFNSVFTGLSGSIGATYQFSEKVFTKLNLSRGFRSPNIAEISANGVHEGTVNYIIGVPGLRAENGLQLDYALGFNFTHITAEADLFSNHISNYIFLSKLVSISGGDSLSNGFSTFKYASGDADLFGGEFIIDIHPHPFDWLHFENTFSYVQSIQRNQPDSTKYLPFSPPPKYTSELRATKKKWSKHFLNTFIKFGVGYYFRQNKYYAAFGTETATPDYLLLNIGIGSDIMAKNKVLFSLYATVDNLADVAYQSHLSRLKYEPVNNTTCRTGVYNMGRNFSFKLIFPIDFSKKTGT
jgi:iron complex outermembrane recepter protein